VEVYGGIVDVAQVDVHAGGHRGSNIRLQWEPRSDGLHKAFGILRSHVVNGRLSCISDVNYAIKTIGERIDGIFIGHRQFVTDVEDCVPFGVLDPLVDELGSVLKVQYVIDVRRSLCRCLSI
jgi:hypothetical protein